MHRTNIYLTDEQVKELDERAALAGTNRSEVVRELLDEGLRRPAKLSPGAVAALTELGERWDELVGDMFQDDPDLRIER
jgi:metal-responsive CopG/Arc/MetJ family transcriptional regulator